jgi:hypothetical protein
MKNEVTLQGTGTPVGINRCPFCDDNSVVPEQILFFRDAVTVPVQLLTCRAWPVPDVVAACTAGLAIRVFAAIALNKSGRVTQAVNTEKLARRTDCPGIVAAPAPLHAVFVSHAVTPHRCIRVAEAVLRVPELAVRARNQAFAITATVGQGTECTAVGRAPAGKNENDHESIKRTSSRPSFRQSRFHSLVHTGLSDKTCGDPVLFKDTPPAGYLKEF